MAPSAEAERRALVAALGGAFAASGYMMPLVKGTDFGVVADGRLKAITGFFDHVAQA